MDIKMIAAIGKNNELGQNNDLIWHFKEDMRFFRNITSGKAIIMGRKTFESLPKLLPNRKHIVLTKNSELIFPSEVLLVRSKEEFLKNYSEVFDEIFVIGGSSIYSLFLNDASDLYLTEIDSFCNEADVFFPKFNKNEFDREMLLDSSENNIHYQINKYTRKRKRG